MDRDAKWISVYARVLRSRCAGWSAWVSATDPLPGCLVLWCPTVRVSPRLLIGFEMETISSIAEVVCCVVGFCLRVFTAFAVSLGANRKDVVPFRVKGLCFKPPFYIHIKEYNNSVIHVIFWWKIVSCTQGHRLVIKIARQCNLVYVQWLESVEALRQVLEQLGRSPQSPLIRCLVLICLSAPEERSWSRCFHPPLPVFSFPQGERERERAG